MTQQKHDEHINESIISSEAKEWLKKTALTI